VSWARDRIRRVGVHLISSRPYLSRLKGVCGHPLGGTLAPLGRLAGLPRWACPTYCGGVRETVIAAWTNPPREFEEEVHLSAPQGTENVSLLPFPLDSSTLSPMVRHKKALWKGSVASVLAAIDKDSSAWDAAGRETEWSSGRCNKNCPAHNNPSVRLSGPGGPIPSLFPLKGEGGGVAFPTIGHNFCHHQMGTVGVVHTSLSGVKSYD